MQKIRNSQLDLLRAISMFMVVMLHVASQGFYTFGPFWKVALVYNAFSRVAVPIMFMISGVCLIPREESMKTWGVRLCKRGFLSYLCWSVVYLLYVTIKGSKITFSNVNFFLQPPYFHMWFMLYYLTYQLSLPLLRGFWNNKCTSHITKKYIILTSLGYGILTEFIPLLLGYAIIGFKISCLPYYIGMSMLGVYLKEDSKQIKCTIWIWLYITCSFLTFFLTSLKSYAMGVPIEMFFEYTSPITIIGSVGLFCYIMSLSIPESIKKITEKIASVSFSIYYLHPLLLDILEKSPLHITWDIWNPIIWIPLYTLAIISICIFLIGLLRICIKCMKLVFLI